MVNGYCEGGSRWSPTFCFWLQVSATFAASLVTSPAIGAYLGRVYGDSLVVVLATAIALLDICFILVAVPESLSEKMRPASWGAPISWEQADPFAVSFSLVEEWIPDSGGYEYLTFFLMLFQESTLRFIYIFITIRFSVCSPTWPII